MSETTYNEDFLVQVSGADIINDGNLAACPGIRNLTRQVTEQRGFSASRR